MSNELAGKRVAILCGDGVELLELVEPRMALQAAGAETVLIAPAKAPIKAWNMTQWDREFDVDLALAEAPEQNFDALHLPGGPLNADVLRRNDFAMFYINEYYFKPDKPVSILCHAPWYLAEIDHARGRTLTSYVAIQTDMMNAGANWVDRAAVVDGNLVSGRHPADTPEFNPVMIRHFATYQPRPRDLVTGRKSERPTTSKKP